MVSVQTIGKGPVTGLPLITKEEAINQGCTNIEGGTTPATPAVATVQGIVTVASQDPIADVLELHYRKKKSLILWGSSGYGKSSTVRTFADTIQAEVVPVYAITLDPITTAMPVPDTEKGTITSYPGPWLKRVAVTGDASIDSKPVVLLLDEINKYANSSVMNMLNELILDRQYAGHKLRDNVFVVGCANFVAESEAASQLDVSILKRVTNVLFAPSAQQIVDNMRSKLGATLAGKLKPESKGKELFETEILSNLDKNTPRQIDEIAELVAGEALSKDVIEMICIGRIGKDGSKIVNDILKLSTYVDKLDASTKDKVVAMAKSGATTEAQGLIEKCDDSEIACYVALTAKSATLVAAVRKKFGKVLYKGESFAEQCIDAGIIK